LLQIFPTTDLNPYYYVIDSFSTYSRNEAILRSRGAIDRIKFYFMDHIWDQTDFSVEPEKSLEELAHERCRRLRDEYDWLCLWLSAGYDSQTVMKYFVDSGVRIDEIAHIDKSGLFNDPESHYVKSTAEWYRLHHNPALKLTMVKQGLDSANFYIRDGENWILRPGAILRFCKTGINNVITFNDDVRRNLDKTPLRRADINGHDKPRLDLRDDAWWMFMMESTMAPVIGVKTVEFFLPEDQPEFFVKQCYHSVRYFENKPDVSHDLVHQIQRLKKDDYAAWNLALGRTRVSCPGAIDGSLKFTFEQSRSARDGLKLLDHLEKTNRLPLNIWNDGLDRLQKAAGDIDIFSINLASKQWRICEFGRFKNKNPTTSVTEQVGTISESGSISN